MSTVKSYLLEFLSFMARYINVTIINNGIPAIFSVGATVLVYTSLGVSVPPFWFFVWVVVAAAICSTLIRFLLAAVFPHEKQYSDRLKRVEEVE